MAVDFGRNLLMSISQESSYNTYIATGHEAFTVLPGATMTTEQDMREELSARNQSAPSPYDVAAGLRRCTFSCSMNLPKEALAHLLYPMLGAVTTTAITSYDKHVLNVNDPALGTSPTPPSLSIRLLDDNTEWHLSGCALQRMVLRMLLDNFWMVDLTFIGGSYATAALGAAPSPTVPGSGRHYLLSDDFDFTVNAVSWAAEAFEVTFERQYAEGPAESYESGSAERVRLESAGSPAFNVFGSTRRLYDGTTQFNLLDNFTEFAIVMTNKVIGGENLVAIDSDGYALKLDFQKCRVESWGKEDSSGITMQRLDWRGFWTTANDIVVTAQDTLATPATGGTP